MDFRELLKVRRSIREFEARDVSLPLIQEIGLPEDYAIVATIILGYPVKIPEKTPRDKPKILRIMQ